MSCPTGNAQSTCAKNGVDAPAGISPSAPLIASKIAEIPTGSSFFGPKEVYFFGFYPSSHPVYSIHGIQPVVRRQQQGSIWELLPDEKLIRLPRAVKNVLFNALVDVFRQQGIETLPGQVYNRDRRGIAPSMRFFARSLGLHRSLADFRAGLIEAASSSAMQSVRQKQAAVKKVGPGDVMAAARPLLRYLGFSPETLDRLSAEAIQCRRLPGSTYYAQFLDAISREKDLLDTVQEIVTGRVIWKTTDQAADEVLKRLARLPDWDLMVDPQSGEVLVRNDEQPDFTDEDLVGPLWAAGYPIPPEIQMKHPSLLARFGF